MKWIGRGIERDNALSRTQHITHYTHNTLQPITILKDGRLYKPETYKPET